MNIKSGVVAAVVGTVAAATATAALASPGSFPHSYGTPVPTGTAHPSSAHSMPTRSGSSGYGKPAPITPVPTASGPSTPVSIKPTHARPAHSAPAHATPTATTSPAPTATGHSVPGHGKPGHPKAITVTSADNGKTIHVARGERVMVTLAVNLKHNPDATTWWHAITESGGALKELPQTFMVPRGVTAARYDAIAAGKATLSSTRAVCPTHSGAPTCHSMQSWHVTIDVR